MAHDDPGFDTIFGEAIEIPSAEDRASFLARTCGEDQGLRRRLERLIEAHFQAGSFLEAPPAPATDLIAPASSIEGPGTFVGPYKLLQQIGEGGMGVVYMAEQEQPVRRRVALKVIKPGMDTAQVVARFEAERRALALMDHPNIARVLDAGATESGRPYFVMELVAGVPMTEYCDQARLNPRQRLELFVPVCRAIQHAHQKGIIHRDVKPSNVLVTVVDGRPTPKVIDFGVAKATEQRLTERTLFTQFGSIVGTLEYMSPEQAEMGGLDVDTRSDVYSLGVLLYELLTGSTPLGRARLREDGYAEILRRIREEEPPPPSTRLSGSGEAMPSIAASRHTEPSRLARLVRGELDWIAMRALEKDRTRRYDSAGAFAADVERYLADEAVEACPPSRRYRLGKFARRHRATLATAGAFAGLLVLATSVSTWLAVRAWSAERATRSEADKVKAINEFLTQDILTQAEPGKNAAEDQVTLLEVVDRAAAKVGRRFPDQPEVEAALRFAIYKTYHALGAWARAEEQIAALYELERRLHGEDSPESSLALGQLGHIDDHLGRTEEALLALRRASEGLRKRLGPDHLNSISIRGSLAEALQSAGRIAEATAVTEENLKRCMAVLGPDHPLTLALQVNLAKSHEAAGRTAEAGAIKGRVFQREEARQGSDDPNTLANRGDLAKSHAIAGRTAEAIAMGEETLKRMKARMGTDHPQTRAVRHNLSVAYLAAGRTAEAIPLLEETLEGLNASEGPDHPQTLTCRSNLAGAYAMAGRTAEAISIYEESLQRTEAKLGPDHEMTLRMRSNVASAYLTSGRLAEAIPRLEQTHKAMTAKLGPAHPSTLDCRSNLAAAYGYTGRTAEAIALNEETLRRRQATLGPDHPHTLKSRDNLSDDYCQAGRTAEAIALNEETLRLATSRHGPDHAATLNSRNFLAAAFESAGRPDAAETQRRAVLESQRRRPVAEPLDLADALTMLGRVLLTERKFDEALPLLREALEIREKAFSDDWSTFDTRSLLGSSLEGLKRYDEAEPLIVSGYDGMKAREAQLLPTDRPRLVEAAARVVRLYETWGKPEKAEEWRKKLEPAGPQAGVQRP